MNGTLKIGIVGTGQIIHDAYLPILPFVDSLSGIVLFDLDQDSATFMKESFESWVTEGIFGKDYSHYFEGAEKKGALALQSMTIAESLEELLDKVDVVLVTTPPHAHLSIALQVATAGKYVIMEKPLTLTTENVHKLTTSELDLLKRRMIYLDTFLFNPGYAKVRELVESGVVGQPLYAEIFLANSGPGQFRDKEVWRLDKDIAGGGALFDWGTHTLALALHIVGTEKPLIKTEVHELVRKKPNPTMSAIDYHSTVSLFVGEEKSPINLLVESSWLSSKDSSKADGKTFIKVEGSKGTIYLEMLKDSEGKRFAISTKKKRGETKQNIQKVFFPHDSYFFALTAAVQCVYTKSIPHYMSFDFGLEILEIIEYILKQKTT